MNKDQKRQQADRRNEMERDQKAKDQWGMWEQETSNNSVKATVNASPNKNEAIHDEKMDQPQREPELPFDKLAHGLGKSSVDSLEDTHISGGGSMPPGFNSGKGMGVLHPGNSQMQYENRRDQNRGNDRYGNQYHHYQSNDRRYQQANTVFTDQKHEDSSKDKSDVMDNLSNQLGQVNGNLIGSDKRHSKDRFSSNQSRDQGKKPMLNEREAIPVGSQLVQNQPQKSLMTSPGSQNQNSPQQNGSMHQKTNNENSNSSSRPMSRTDPNSGRAMQNKPLGQPNGQQTSVGSAAPVIQPEKRDQRDSRETNQPRDRGDNREVNNRSDERNNRNQNSISSSPSTQQENKSKYGSPDTKRSQGTGATKSQGQTSYFQKQSNTSGYNSSSQNGIMSQNTGSSYLNDNYKGTGVFQDQREKEAVVQKTIYGQNYNHSQHYAMPVPQHPYVSNLAMQYDIYASPNSQIYPATQTASQLYLNQQQTNATRAAAASWSNQQQSSNHTIDQNKNQMNKLFPPSSYLSSNNNPSMPATVLHSRQPPTSVSAQAQLAANQQVQQVAQQQAAQQQAQQQQTLAQQQAAQQQAAQQAQQASAAAGLQARQAQQVAAQQVMYAQQSQGINSHHLSAVSPNIGGIQQYGNLQMNTGMDVRR